jgi:hypothetical protein
MKVRVTASGGGGSDQHLMRAGLADLDVLDHQRLANFTEYGGFHRDFLSFGAAGGRSARNMTARARSATA